MSFFIIMKFRLIYIIALFVSISAISQELIPTNVLKLITAYPSGSLRYKNGYVIFKNGTQIKYEESKNRSHKALINSFNLGDIFAYQYKKGTVTSVDKNQDAGRIRNEEFLKIYTDQMLLLCKRI